MARHECLKDINKVRQGIELALSEIEIKALNWWRQRSFTSEANIAHVAHYAMQFALQNPDHFRAWLSGVTRYTEAEDIEQMSYMRSRLLANRGYRRAVAKTHH